MSSVPVAVATAATGSASAAGASAPTAALSVKRAPAGATPASLARMVRTGRTSPKLPSAVGRAMAWTARTLSAASPSRSPNRSKGRLAARPWEATATTLGRAPKT